MFDEEPDGDPHGECAAEIHRLQAAIERSHMALRRSEAHVDRLTAEVERLREQLSITACIHVTSETPAIVRETSRAAAALSPTYSTKGSLSCQAASDLRGPKDA